MTNFEFNPGQQKVRDAIVAMIANFDTAPPWKKGRVLVTALAGCGKSWAIMRAIQEAVDAGMLDKSEVCFVYPTNKLKIHFGKVLSADGYPIESFQTIYSLLKYYPVVVAEDKSVLTTDAKDTADQTPPFKVVIVDEAYALPRVLIETIFSLPQSLWILSGDPRQLPPVGEKISTLAGSINLTKVFDCNLRLTEVMRQSDSDLAEQVSLIERLGVKYQPERTRKDLIFKTQCLPRILDGEDVLILSYTNWLTREYSTRVLAALADHLGVGEAEDPMFYTGAKLTVKGIYIGSRMIVPTNDLITVEGYEADKGLCHYEYDGELLSAKVWTAQIETELKAKANKKIKEGIRASKAWAEYEVAKAKHIQATSAYVSTIHSSQGLTADHVYVNWSSILTAKENADQLAYVAVSRSAKSVGFLF